MKLVELFSTIRGPVIESQDPSYGRGWVRFWVNTKTKEIIPVPESHDHDGYLEDNPNRFGEPHYDAMQFDSEEDKDAALERVYERGWTTVLYDPNRGELSIRSHDLSDLHGAAKAFARKYHLDRIVADVGNQSVDLHGRTLQGFIRTGKIRGNAFLKENAQYNLKARYDEFNQKYFEGKLPEIPVKFSSLKGIGGKVTAKIRVIPGAPKPNPMMVRMGLQNKHQNKELVPGSMVLHLSDLFQRTSEHLDGILLHEMIHVWFYTIGDFGETHGAKFLKKLREVQELSGIKIPLTDSSEGLELRPDATRTVIVVLVQQQSGPIFLMISPTMLNKLINPIRAYMSNTSNPWKIIAITTPLWSTVAARVPLTRKFDKSWKVRWYRAKPEWVADLQNGTILEQGNQQVAESTDEYSEQDGWWHPEHGFIPLDRARSHTETVLENPEQFQIDPKVIRRLAKADRDDPRNDAIMSVVFRNGWVRVTGGGHYLGVETTDPKMARACIRFMMDRMSPNHVIVDIPGNNFVIELDREQAEFYVKYGRVPTPMNEDQHSSFNDAPADVQKLIVAKAIDLLHYTARRLKDSRLNHALFTHNPELYQPMFMDRWMESDVIPQVDDYVFAETNPEAFQKLVDNFLNDNNVFAAERAKHPEAVAREESRKITERRIVLPRIGSNYLKMQDDLPALLNPSASELIGFIKRSKHQKLRGLVSGRDVYWWDASLATHGDVAKSLNDSDYLDNRMHLNAEGDRYVLDFDDSVGSRMREIPSLLTLGKNPDIAVYLMGRGWVSLQDYFGFTEALTETHLYHVAQDWDGGDLESLSRRVGDDQALQMWKQKWSEGGDLGHAHIHLIHLHDTLDQARAYQAEYGGQILEIDPDQIDVRRDNVEYDHPVTHGPIPKQAVKVITEDRKSEFEILKANKIPLSDEERAKVMKTGAVWHHGPGGKSSPAVWKSKNSKGQIRYVCNTHRMYQVRDTLDAAIKTFPEVEETS